MKKGFTLIELLVVIAIIGVLASVVMVSVGGSRGQANAAKAVTMTNQAMMAYELCNSMGASEAFVGQGGSPIVCGGDTIMARSPKNSDPAGYTYTITGTTYSAGDYKIVTSGFTPSTENFTCENGACVCSTATGCKK